MEGITVLSSEVVGSGSTVFLILGIVYLVLACAVLAFGIYIGVDSNGSALGLCIILGASVFVLSILGVSSITDRANGKEYKKLKIIVDDSVEFNEFMSRYEILDQDGDIWIVKEKE